MNGPKMPWRLIIGIIITWAISGFIIYIIFEEPANRGTFGDMFGAINSLFSGLALAGIIYTIYLQKHELGLQRKELEETRKQLKRSAEAQEKSEVILRKTAEINALSTLINYHGKVAGILRPNSFERAKLEFEKANKHIEKLKTLIEENSSH